jgi:hypothetical protein
VSRGDLAVFRRRLKNPRGYAESAGCEAIIAQWLNAITEQRGTLLCQVSVPVPRLAARRAM